MLKNIFPIFQKEAQKEYTDPIKEEFEELSNNLKSFSSLLTDYNNKNLILKNYDSLDLNILEFINKQGRNSFYGQKAVELSKKLSEYYNYFKENSNTYLDEKLAKKLNTEEYCKKIINQINFLKSNKLNQEQIETKVIQINSQIKKLIAFGDQDYKRKLTQLKNELVGFYKNSKQEKELDLINSNLSDINIITENLKPHLSKENKSEEYIFKINNRILELNNRYNNTKDLINRLNQSQKNKLLNQLNKIYNSLDSYYANHLDKLNYSQVIYNKEKAPLALKINNLIQPIFESYKHKIKSNQNNYLKNQSNSLTNLLKNIDNFSLNKLKNVFVKNNEIYEKSIINTNHALLFKFLLDELEKNIVIKFQEERLNKKRKEIAKVSYKELKKINRTLEKHKIEDLQTIYNQNLENYNTHSQHTNFNKKINSILKNIDSKIKEISNKNFIDENKAQQFLSKINNIISNYENYSVKYLTQVIEKTKEVYTKDYINSKLNKNIEFSITSLSNTLYLLNLLVNYVDNDLELTEKQRILLRDITSKTYKKLFSLNNNFLFNLTSKRVSMKIRKLFDIEIQRKLILEEVNNNILTMDLSSNTYINLLMNKLVNIKPHQNEDLKDMFIDISNKILKNDKESLNEAILKLNGLSNSVIPLRKKSLLELKSKLK